MSKSFQLHFVLFLGKVLIVTGSIASGNVGTSEIIDLKNSQNTCNDFGNHTKEVFSASGGLLDNEHPLICGGVYGFGLCQTMGKLNLTAYLNEKRSFAGNLFCIM